MKDYYTKEQRRAYNRVWQSNHAKRHDSRQHICDCGQPARLHRGSEWICSRCKASETPAARAALGLVTRHDGNILWDELGIAVRRMLAVPEWMRHWCNRETAPEGNAGDLLNRITVSIEEREREIIIHAHGCYHLQINQVGMSV